MNNNQEYGIKLKKPVNKKEIKSVVSPSQKDGSAVLNGYASAGGYYGYAYNIDSVIKSENELIRRYRDLSQLPEVDTAITEIVSDAIVYDDLETYPVKLNLDKVKLQQSVKDDILKEFDTLLPMFDGKNLDDLFRLWYIDGRCYHYILVNPDNPTSGIQELRYIDPRKIKRIKDIKKKRNEQGIEVIDSVEEYYLFNDNGIDSNTSAGLKLSLDSVIEINSGLYDSSTGMILSYLNKALKPANQLRMLEDSTVIYRVSRAPERRVFYIDVGNLPKLKAEQYVNDIMSRFTNKITYNAQTGDIQENTRQFSMLEDYYIPRREGGKGTEITTLPGGQSLGQLDDVNYFQNKLQKSLNVPVSRLQGDAQFNFGRTSEITRDEVKFSKFIAKLRNKFSGMFLKALKIQLVAKKIINLSDWNLLETDCTVVFNTDNYFSELKETEILLSRINTISAMESMVGKYYSKEWIAKNVLRMTTEEIEENKKQIEIESKESDEQEEE